MRVSGAPGKLRLRSDERGVNLSCGIPFDAPDRAEDGGVCEFKIGAKMTELQAFKDKKK